MNAGACNDTAGDVLLFCQALDGNASNTVHLVEALADQLQTAGEDKVHVFMVNSDLYSTDYERLCSTSEAWIYVAMIRLMLKRLAIS